MTSLWRYITFNHAKNINIQICFMWNNHHTKFHQNTMNKESGVGDGPLFSRGGIMISRRKESFLHHRLSTSKFFPSTPAVQTIFLKSPNLANILGGLCRHFFQMHLWGTQFFFNFFHSSCRQFFPNHNTPGENNGSSLMLADSTPLPKSDRGKLPF